MHNSAWTALFRLLPPAHQAQLSLTTSSGTEIAVQSIVRMEADYLVIRGRIMGTTDNAGFLIVPFDQITFLGLPRNITEPEVRAIYGESNVSSPPPTVSQPSRAASPAPPAQPVDRTDAESRPSELDKTSLLERLRARRSLSETAKGVTA